MPELTPKLGIKKPLGNETVSRAAFNENWDIIDQNAQKNITQSATAPSEPVADDLWIDTSTSPYGLKKWDGAAWQKIGAVTPGDIGAETPAGAQAKADAAEAAAKTYADQEVADLAGEGRTTETVKGNADALGSHLSDYVLQVPYAEATGSANTYAVTLNPIPSAYVDGMAIAVKINVNNTGASTININGLGAKTIKKPNGNDVSAGNLKAGSIYSMRYNGTNFILQGSDSSGNAIPGDVLAGKTFSNDEDTNLTGTMPNRGAVVITPSTSNQAIAAGYHNGNGYVKGEPNLVAENIKSGVNIFGITGNLQIYPAWDKYYLYVPGLEFKSFVEYQVEGGGSFRKDSNHLEVYAAHNAEIQECAGVLDNSIDLTYFSKIYFDWANLGASSANNQSAFIVSSTKFAGIGVFNLRNFKTSKFSRIVENIDVSSLSGNYYLRIHARDNDTSLNTSQVRVYNIWLEP